MEQLSLLTPPGSLNRCLANGLLNDVPNAAVSTGWTTSESQMTPTITIIMATRNPRTLPITSSLIIGIDELKRASLARGQLGRC